MKNTLSCKIDVDTKDIERLVYGGRMYDALSWRPGATHKSILGYDNESETITVSEQGLLRLIQLACPSQVDRKIKLV